MRGMIVAAGLGTRLHPLTQHRAKPAVPVRGIPMIAYSLAFLARAGVNEIVINVHHLPESLIAAAQHWCPAHLKLQFSHEPELLHTGGAIRRVATFLRESDPCVVLGGDMILDFDLAAVIRRHREDSHAATLVLREDPREPSFGTIGLDGKGCVRRVARRFDLGGAQRAGIYTWANLFSPRALESLPDRQIFNHLDDWLVPLLTRGADDIRGVVLPSTECVWEPVGTLSEYLQVNLRPPELSYLDPDALAREDGTRIEGDCVIGRGAVIGAGARLQRAVVWDGEKVPEGFEGKNGVYAGGAFHPCVARPDTKGEALG
jgi:NDP-sugar pyrophosphorylase family protein